MGKEWKFTQLGGAKRVVRLTGASAPHGRPRQRPVVTDGIKLRKQRVFYPDAGNRPPTTHIFGTQWSDWDLEGRFSDVWLGPGGTLSAIRDWQTLVAEGLGVEILWGDVLGAIGLVDSIEPGRESEFECTYKITVCIDQRDIQGGFTDYEIPIEPLALCQALQVELDGNISVIPRLQNAGDLKPDFLDSLEESVASINALSVSLINIAGSIDAFEEATMDQLERLRAGVVQMRTAVHLFRGTVESTENDAMLLARAADTDVLWFAQRAAADVSTMRLLDLLDQLDREADLARRSRPLASYLAKLGDSWESIATIFYGGPADAGAIRNTNGIRYGSNPVPGRTYQIPVV